MGFQIGGELMNVILILRTQSAVNVFKTGTQVSLGAGLSVSVGPVGRAAETELHAGTSGATAAYSCKLMLRLMSLCCVCCVRILYVYVLCVLYVLCVC